MAFSVSCELVFMCLTVLLFIPAQGQLETVTREQPRLDHVIPSCCTAASTAPVVETVKACYEQREHIFPNCKIHAYIFVTESNRAYCVDPSASWLPKRLEKLKERGILCKLL
uniref:Chemokine interleukin-8-like domain-containing protein n=1 Tax=Lates calcarifer TaxID=8187 RepID=A0A4W6EAW1_LATCA